MDCEDFAHRLASFVASDEESPAGAEHAEKCDACATSLRRANRLASLLRELPRERPPSSLDKAVLSAPFHPTPRLPRLLRVAAALLITVGVGGAVLHLSDSSPDRPRYQLTVIVENGNGDDHEELALEEIYGPEGPYLAIGGGQGD